MQKDKKLIILFEKWSGEKSLNITALPLSGSAREYYRITGRNKTAIGVFNSDKKENIAFLTFSKHFFSKGLRVPEIYCEDLKNNVYLIQDLGDTTLFSFLTAVRKDGGFPADLISFYKKVIEQLPLFQIIAGKDLDYSVCYPRSSFDQLSMMWDLNYFKYYFLKLAKVPFDEQHLEDDFRTFTDYLLQAESEYFLYRDFQSRNVMIYNGEPYFIDYQGGRKGALHYDLASLLYDAKADIPLPVRAELLHHYIETTGKLIPINELEFTQYFFGFVLIRMLQAMGAYGYRGFYERKEHFLKSIPFALRNLEWILNTVTFPVKLPTLLKVLRRMIDSEELKKYGETKATLNLTILINSFSYKKGIPEDKTGNGGGFVFDCRAINNPGRYDQYRSLTGRDQEVIEFLETESDVNKFLIDVYSLVDRTVENYQKRFFTNLMINFGCTGGQHRSVYCAEKLAKHLKDKFDVKVKINHRELGLVKQIE
ncbi:MAG: phosphotransferase [Ignavibacteriales bacterium]|nr:phosphotransferase [Ignavibacteriales bacterium]